MKSDPERNDAEDIPEPPRLRQLRWLVNTLLLVLIAGVVIITTLLVIRLAPLGTPPPVPGNITLPAGERAGAVTFGNDWIALVTTDEAGAERIRILDRTTGIERAVIPILQVD